MNGRFIKNNAINLKIVPKYYAKKFGPARINLSTVITHLSPSCAIFLFFNNGYELLYQQPHVEVQQLTPYEKCPLL